LKIDGGKGAGIVEGIASFENQVVEIFSFQSTTHHHLIREELP